MSVSNDLPLVSIITPSFNQGRFITDTIESVLSQNYPKLEYLVMDGGSTDETLDILRSYGNRLTWRSGPDGGQADAVNAGFRLAQGEILGWLNSDDTYLPGAVEAAVTHLTTHQNTAMVYGDAYYIDERNRVIGIYPTEDFDQHRLAKACFICQPAAFFRRSAIEAIGGLDTRLQYCMDYELWIRLARRFLIDRIPYVLASSRQYPQTKTWSQRDRLFEELCAVTQRSFGYTSRHWRMWHAYARLKGFSWPLARTVLYPARTVLPERLFFGIRRRLPLWINRLIFWDMRAWKKRI
ncbi:MAG: glycosyltransferase [Candidatus Methylomirabilota bacterium]|nr:MAG: glycosyltransferase [candidate division NC10 bacterium]